MLTMEVPSKGVAEFIKSLAKTHGVAYVQTPHDAMADVITRLADDDVQLDEIELLVIALVRAGVVSSEHVVPLQVNYLREKLNVRPV